MHLGFYGIIPQKRKKIQGEKYDIDYDTYDGVSIETLYGRLFI